MTKITIDLEMNFAKELLILLAALESINTMPELQSGIVFELNNKIQRAMLDQLTIDDMRKLTGQ